MSDAITVELERLRLEREKAAMDGDYERIEQLSAGIDALIVLRETDWGKEIMRSGLVQSALSCQGSVPDALQEIRGRPGPDGSQSPHRLWASLPGRWMQ
jgi:hypothetical protein